MCTGSFLSISLTLFLLSVTASHCWHTQTSLCFTEFAAMGPAAGIWSGGVLGALSLPTAMLNQTEPTLWQLRLCQSQPGSAKGRDPNIQLQDSFRL